MAVQPAQTKRDDRAPGASEASRLLEGVDELRRANMRLNGSSRALLGQFLTPPEVASFMASMFSVRRQEIRLLDPGAGVGSLTAAFVARLLGQSHGPRSITVVAYEINPTLARHYAFTDEELDFTVNYDIKYRMSGSDDDDQEG